MTDEQLTHIFTYQPPKPGDVEKYGAIRAAALEFSRVLVANTPSSADQSAAIRKVREAVMTANASIALAEDVDPFENDTLLDWDASLKESGHGRGIRVVGVKCVDLPGAAWDCWKAAGKEDVAIEVAIERLRALGLNAEIVEFD